MLEKNVDAENNSSGNIINKIDSDHTVSSQSTQTMSDNSASKFSVKRFIKKWTYTAIAVYLFVIAGSFLFTGGISLGDITAINAYEHAKTLVSEKKLKDAEEYLQLYIDIPLVGNKPEMQELLGAVQKEREQWTYRVEKALSAFMQGSSDEDFGIIVAGISDLLVVGDIRDIYHECQKILKKEEPDKLTLALATVGLVTAAAGFGPQAPAAVTVKSGASTLKVANKLKFVSPKLSKFTIEAFDIAKKSKSIKPIVPIMESIGSVIKSGGSKSALLMIKNSDNVRDMIKYTEVIKKIGAKSYGYLKFGGRYMSDILLHYGEGSAKMALAFGKKGVWLMQKVTPSKFEFAIRVGKMCHTGALSRHVSAFLSILSPVVRFGFMGTMLLWIAFLHTQFVKNGMLCIYRKIRRKNIA